MILMQRCYTRVTMKRLDLPYVKVWLLKARSDLNACLCSCLALSSACAALSQGRPPLVELIHLLSGPSPPPEHSSSGAWSLGPAFNLWPDLVCCALGLAPALCSLVILEKTLLFPD